MTKWVSFKDLSEYNHIVDIMLANVESLINNPNQENMIMLVEHEDVYSAGLSYKPEELLDTGDIPVIYSRRGGRFTYHGPGQRVIYPIINLSNQKDIRLYIRNLEKWIINSLSHFGLKAFTIEGLVGIWVNNKASNKPEKIAAIGVKVKKWVTYHGVAVNINTDIDRFSRIIPCGIKDYSVTSLKEQGVNISLNEFDEILKKEFDKVF